MVDSLQLIVMTSDKSSYLLRAFCHQWDKYFSDYIYHERIICGFSPIKDTPKSFDFYSIGSQSDYPINRWSDALIKVLNNVANDIFILMLDDYLLVRPTDTRAVKMIADYCHQFKYVIKFDLTTERLFADGGGKYNFGYHTYDTLGYLDLIKSSPGSPYHLSLWGGVWRRDLLRDVLIPGETAQQIELNGTHRLSQKGDEVLVLGSRQAPMRHANVIQGGKPNQDVMVGLPALTEGDREELKELGYL